VESLRLVVEEKKRVEKEDANKSMTEVKEEDEMSTDIQNDIKIPETKVEAVNMKAEGEIGQEVKSYSDSEYSADVETSGSHANIDVIKEDSDKGSDKGSEKVEEEEDIVEEDDSIEAYINQGNLLLFVC
jgi:hypothetical protein